MTCYLIDGVLTNDITSDQEDSGTILLTKFGITKRIVVGKSNEWTTMSFPTRTISKIKFRTKGELIKYYRKSYKILLDGKIVTSNLENNNKNLLKRILNTF